MPSLTIVPNFNIFKDSLFSHDPRLEILLIDQLRLQAFEKAFSHGIVPAIAFPAHALQYQRVFFEQSSKAMTGILNPSIRLDLLHLTGDFLQAAIEEV